MLRSYAEILGELYNDRDNLGDVQVFEYIVVDEAQDLVLDEAQNFNFNLNRNSPPEGIEHAFRALHQHGLFGMSGTIPNSEAVENEPDSTVGLQND